MSTSDGLGAGIRPYVELLGIPPSQCPPNYYQLLSIDPREADLARIAQAARRRAAEINQHAPLTAEARQLLHEITRAKLCLLDPQSRAEYDAQLHGSAAPAVLLTTAATRTVAPTPPAAPMPLPVQPVPSPSSVAALRPIPVNRPADGGNHVTSLVSPRESVNRSKRNRRSHSLRRWGVTLGVLLIVWMLLPDWNTLLSLVQQEQQSPLASNAPSLPEPSPAPQRTATAPAAEVNAPAMPKSDADNDKPAKNAPQELTPNRRPTATTPPKGDPFAQLPMAVDLPPRGVWNALEKLEEAGTGNLDIGLIGKLNLAQAEFRIDDTFADLQDRFRFAIVANSQSAEPTWDIQLIPMSGGDLHPIAARNVAHLRMANDRLLFAWNLEFHDPLGGQLRNCTLHLSDGPFRRSMPLRSVQQTKPITLEFDESEMRIMVPCEAPPAFDNIYLEVVSFNQFGSGWQMKPAEGRVKLGERLHIEHASPDVKITLKLEEAAGGLKATITPRYELGSRSDPFTTEQVRTTLLSLGQTLNSNLRTLKEAQTAGQTLTRQIRHLQSLPVPSGPKREPVLFQRQAQIGDLQVALKKAASTARRMQNSIPKTKAALDTLKKLAALGEQMRGRAHVELRIVAQTGAQSMVLYDASQ